MSDRSVCLEAVELKGSHEPRRVAGAWLSRGALMFLLERLAVKQIKTAEAPPFGWILNTGYVYRAEGPQPGASAVTAAITSRNPIPALCVDPDVVATALRWVQAAIRSDALMDRRAAWNELGSAGTFDEDRFVAEFDDDLQRWLAVCARAKEIGGMVGLRVDD